MECDYLVVGAGTASLSFVDTLLTHSDSATIIIVDRNDRPGGHWVHAYPFVRLHQQSCSYGVNSRTLGTLRGRKQIEVFDIDDRATGHEILEYYAEVVKSFEATKRVRVFFSTEYSCEDGNHIISSKDGTNAATISCGKLVNCLTKVEVPSMRKPYFAVDESVSMKPLNYLSEAIESRSFDKYVVIGAGKTGTDAIINLLEKNIDPEMITWIFSRDVWYFLRDGFCPKPTPKGKYWKYSHDGFLKPFVEASSLNEIYLNMEKADTVGRLDPEGPLPQVFKGATIYKRDLDMLRLVKDVIRLGRVTSISKNEIILEKGTIPLSCENTLVVDCMADNFYGYINFESDFETFKPSLIQLGPIPMLFNPSLSSAVIGYLEATFHDDAVKNSFLYLPVSKQIREDGLGYFVESVYCHFKTHEQLRKYKPLEKFVQESRTNPDAFSRHGGILPALWAFLGPLKVGKKTEIMMEKYTNPNNPNRYSDIDDPFPGREEVDASLLEGALRVDSGAKKGCFAK